MISNPLQRDGTHQFQRLAQALEEDYVKIEDRSEQELLSYAARLAKHIQYYNAENVPDGDWSVFFEAEDAQPQKALFLGFVKLLSLLQEFANGLTRRHLDYYYEQVLQLVKEEADPAQVHVFFTIATGLKEKFLAKGTLLNAGKAEDGTALLYELAEEIVVNQAHIVEVRSQFMESEDFGRRAFANANARVPHNADEPGPFWSLFGETQLKPTAQGIGFQDVFKPQQERTMADAEMGFALASPLLTLREGKRTLVLVIIVDSEDQRLPSGPGTFDELFRVQFDCLLTGDKGWVKLQNSVDKAGQEIVRVKASKVSAGESINIRLELTLIPTDAPIVPYDAALHAGNYDTEHPVLKVVFCHSEEEAPEIPFGYAAWKDLKVSGMELHADVQGVKNLLVQNDIGSIEPSKPFRPFGLQPVIGSHCYIGHPEVFRQPLASLDLTLIWKDAPTDLKAYYKDYASVTNESFTANVAVLEDFQWELLTENAPKPIFDGSGKSEVSLALVSDNLGSISRKSETIGEQEWSFEVP
ncbi:MAG: hypothetical protein AAFQ98_21350, partial [Bacteroidota bacterium]